MSKEPGWAARELQAIREEMKDWPVWMREAALENMTLQTAEESIDDIKDALDKLSEPCLCGTDPYGPCLFCTAVETLRRRITDLDLLEQTLKTERILHNTAKAARDNYLARLTQAEKQQVAAWREQSKAAANHRKAAARAEKFRAHLEEATEIAQQLMLMIDQETWRATGGNDSHGNYEGDYRAERTNLRIQQLAQHAKEDPDEN